MQITFEKMTRKHYTPTTSRKIRCVVVHATGGHPGSDKKYLKDGGTLKTPVSTHYYINKQGIITQFVRDIDIAWHAGVAAWIIDGEETDDINSISVSIELSNLDNGKDPYPVPQVEACLWLTRKLVSDYKIPESQLVKHGEVAPERKHDPLGFPWETFVQDVYRDSGYNRDSLVIGVKARCEKDQWFKWMRALKAPVDDVVLERIWTMCDWLDIDTAFVGAIWRHEQGRPLGSSTLGSMSNNPFNIKAYGRWPSVEYKDVRWNLYESWQLGLMHSVMHLKQMYGATGLLTIEQIIYTFAPASDNNKPEAYIAAVVTDMNAILNM